jgi:hypothetical protein
MLSAWQKPEYFEMMMNTFSSSPEFNTIMKFIKVYVQIAERRFQQDQGETITLT